MSFSRLPSSTPGSSATNIAGSPGLYPSVSGTDAESLDTATESRTSLLNEARSNSTGLTIGNIPSARKVNTIHAQRDDRTGEHELQPLHSHGTTPSHKPPASSMSPTKKTESVWQAWKFEILSNILALGCIVAIVVILAIHQGQPLPKWPDLISINSLIAIFTAVFKASLILPVAEGLGQLKWHWFHRPRRLQDINLFDDASRGPWGSLLLVLKQVTRPDRAYLAIIGAILTILALAIDPLSQAMIEHRPCIRAMDIGEAHIPRTNNYSSSYAFEFRGVEAALMVDQQMMSAIYRGLVAYEDTDAWIDFKCATGNCTFGDNQGQPFFSTLAMCHSCSNITDRIRVNSTGKFSTTIWELTPVSGLVSGPMVGNYGGANFLSTKATQREKKYEEGDDAPFFSLDILSLHHPSCKSQACSFGEMKPFAVRCRLDACVKTLSGEVHNGVYNETEHGPGKRLVNCRTRGDEDRKQVIYALLTNTSLVDGVERSCAETADAAPNSVKLNLTYGIFGQWGYLSGEEEKVVWRSYPQECVWTVDMTTEAGMTSVLRNLMVGDVVSDTTMSVSSAVTGHMWLRRIYAEASGGFHTAEEVFHGLANSITAMMRERPYGRKERAELNGYDDSMPQDLKVATGKPVSTQTCIYVRWGWIAYPLALLVSQWIFSALVQLRGRLQRTSGGDQVMVWKSSPLALLFNGLDGGLRDKCDDCRTLAEMDQAAEKLTVRLVSADGSKRKGFRFSET